MRIVFLNPQGNFDAQDSYWTEHPDFGGQLVYVKEIAIAMASLGHDVDILTRRFDDETIQGFHEPLDAYPEASRVRIVRIACGPNRFVPKEQLWEHLNEWVNNIVEFYASTHETVDFITTHYADGGLAGALLSQRWDVPYSFTGHSLGAQKMDKLHLTQESKTALNQTYQFAKRLLAERIAMQGASTIFTSTEQERDEQYRHPAYQGAGDQQNPEKFVIAPPGVNETVFGATQKNDQEDQTYELLHKTLIRDIDPDRIKLPYIVLASRLDPKKNHLGFLEAYASSPALQSIANVVISLRGVNDAFTDYSTLKENEQQLMNQLMKVIEKSHLRGKVSFVNITSQKALAASYRYFAQSGSVFTLTALYEPFGLAPIEAMCAGLPVAVTQYGGPAEVLKDNQEHYGVLLDVHDLNQVVKGLIHLFKHYDYFRKQGLHRVHTTYTWKATARKYLTTIEAILANPTPTNVSVDNYFITASTRDDFGLKPIEDYYLRGKI
jgi:sucrose-phosphate synthase